jgi:hypothetical protein
MEAEWLNIVLDKICWLYGMALAGLGTQPDVASIQSQVCFSHLLDSLLLLLLSYPTWICRGRLISPCADKTSLWHR